MAGRKRGGYSQATRVLRMVDELKREELTMKDLARTFGVSVRQVHRDLRAIEDAGYLVEAGDEEWHVRITRLQQHQR